MKRMSFVIALLALVFALIVPPASVAADLNSVKVTTLQNGGKLIHIQQIVKTTTAYVSPSFSMDGFLENTSTYPIKASYSLDTSNQNAGTEIDSVKCLLYYTNDPTAGTTNYILGDTLSLTLGTTAYTSTTLDLNNHKGGYWYLKTTGLGANTAALLTVDIYLYRRDH